MTSAGRGRPSLLPRRSSEAAIPAEAKPARRGTAATILVAALMIAGCATRPPVGEAGDALSGRIAVRVEGAQPRAVSAQFDLRGSASNGAFDLSTPIGTMLARARWRPGDVRLLTPDGERRYADLGELARDALGEDVPLVALFDWLRGRPWPGAPSRELPARGFEQLGWEVDLTRFADGRVAAQRAAPPAVSLQVRLDGPG